MRSVPDLLGVQPGEGRSTALMVAHSFFMGLSTVFFETAASALFLSQFAPRSLPWVYIAAAALNTGTGLLYARVQRSASFAHLMMGTLAFLLVTVSGFRVALSFSQAAWLSFALLVFYRAVSILTDLEYWAVAARLYNVRQAKRLFGLIGAGEVIARIVGSFAVPVLVALLGVRNLILLSALAVGACVLVLAPILALMPPDARQEKLRPASAPATRPPVGALTRDRYLMVLLTLAGLAVLGKYFVDFAFLEQMRSRETDVKSLATFFGLFSGITQTLSLLTRLFLSGRILGRYGIGVGLVVMPAAHLICTIATVVAGFTGAGSSAIFWLTISNQGVYKTLKHPIDNPSFKVLYQPLRKDQRLAAQIAVETLVSPVMIGLAGAVMLLFTVVIPFDPVVFAWVMLVSFLAWVLFSGMASREYSAGLVRALQGRFVDHATFSLSDEPSIALVKQKLDSTDAGDVVFGLDLLERFDDKQFMPLLQQRLDHPSPEVRRYVLGRLEALRPPEARERVALRAQTETDPLLRGQAVRCLCALEPTDEPSAALSLMDSPEIGIRRGAIVGVLRHRPRPETQRAKEQLAVLASSPDPQVRRVAAQILVEVDRAGFDALLLALLGDPVTDVRRDALVAAARVSTPEVWREVISDLASPSLGPAASSALVSIGEQAVDDLAARFAETSTRLMRYRAAEVLGRIGGPRAVAALRAQMGIEDGLVRRMVLESLTRIGYVARDEQDRAAILERVRAEAEGAAWATAAYLDLGHDQALVPLKEALLGEVEAARRRVLLLLSFVFDRQAILSARDSLGHESREKRAYALEVLDLTLSKELRDSVLPLLDDISPGQRMLQLGAEFPQAGLSRDQRLTAIVSRPLHAIKPWTRACAVFAAATLGVAEAVASATTERDPLVEQTLAWARGSRQRSGDGGEPMLAIEKVMILKGAQMFANTPEEVLADVASIVEEVDLKAGEVIFRKGDVGDSMYIIIEGQVRVYDGDRTINQLGRRDIFGELALLDPEPRSASIAALADTRLLRIDRETFSELMAGNVSIVRGILHVLCERLRRLIPASAAPAAPPAEPPTAAPR